LRTFAWVEAEVEVSEIWSFFWAMRVVCSEARVASILNPRHSGCV